MEKLHSQFLLNLSETFNKTFPKKKNFSPDNEQRF